MEGVRSPIRRTLSANVDRTRLAIGEPSAPRRNQPAPAAAGHVVEEEEAHLEVVPLVLWYSKVGYQTSLFCLPICFGCNTTSISSKYKLQP